MTAKLKRRPTGAFEPLLLKTRAEWEERFLSKVDTSGSCHEWRGTQNPRTGYGNFYAIGVNFLAHRVAYLLAGGEPGADVVMHSCDNPRCVNPAHLIGGTHRMNYEDMVSKGRRRLPAHLGAHLKDRETHPRCRAVVTPEKTYPSAALAAEAHGITRAAAAIRAKRGTHGWRYADARVI